MGDGMTWGGKRKGAGRPPLGVRAMTDAERQHRWREKARPPWNAAAKAAALARELGEQRLKELIAALGATPHNENNEIKTAGDRRKAAHALPVPSRPAASAKPQPEPPTDDIRAMSDAELHEAIRVLIGTRSKDGRAALKRMQLESGRRFMRRRPAEDELKRLKTARAKVHPDWGGTNEAFHKADNAVKDYQANQRRQKREQAAAAAAREKRSAAAKAAHARRKAATQ
jgi:hypothetical protein